MDNKFYVSYEAARLLKEKGYNEETEYTIDNNGRIWMGEYRDECDFPCPTKSEVIDWLESKGIVIELQYCQEFSTWNYAIYFIIYTYSDEEFPTRLEAEEVAIIKALELL